MLKCSDNKINYPSLLIVNGKFELFVVDYPSTVAPLGTNFSAKAILTEKLDATGNNSLVGATLKRRQLRAVEHTDH